jgi:hypothetical protein
MLMQAWESDTKAIVTFTVNNAVYNVQVIDKNTTANVTAPANTAYFQFLGWTVDGETVINLATYNVTANVTFIAKVVNKYDVRFMFDGAEYASQIIAHNAFASVTAPTNTQYKEFLGWSVDGNTIINLAAYPITHTTTFYAVVENSYDVTFKVLGDVYNEQVTKYNTFATAPLAPTLADYTFLGWSVDGTNIVDVSAHRITSATTFFAVVQQKYTVTFMVDGTTHDTQKIAPNGYAAAPANPSVANTTFKGWSINGTATVNPASVQITGNTTFIALFDCTVSFVINSGNVGSQTVARNGYPTTQTPPANSAYDFLGWSLDGVNIVNITTIQITAHMTFYGVVHTYGWVTVFNNQAVDASRGDAVGTQLTTTSNVATINLNTFCGTTVTATKIKIAFGFLYTADGLNYYGFTSGEIVAGSPVTVTQALFGGNVTFTLSLTIGTLTITAQFYKSGTLFANKIEAWQ